MAGDSYVGRYGQGYVVYVGGQQVRGDNPDGTFSSQSAAEQAFNASGGGQFTGGGEPTYNVRGGTKTLAQLRSEMIAASGDQRYATMDAASLIAAYNAVDTSGGGGGGGGGSMSDLLDAIAKTNAANQYSQLVQSLLQTASGLSGPQNWLKYEQSIAGGRKLIDQLYGSNAQPQFTAPSDTTTPLSLYDILVGLGLTPAQAAAAAGTQPAATGNEANNNVPPGTTMSSIVAGLQTPASNAQTFSGGGGIQVNAPPDPPGFQYESAAVTNPDSPAAATGLGRNVPLPFQTNPAVWDSLSGTAKEVVYGALKAGQAEGGYWDPQDWLNQLNAQRPQGSAPRTTRTNWAAPQGVFG